MAPVADSAFGRFWAEALGRGVDSEEPGATNVEPVGFAYPDPTPVCIGVLAVPEPVVADGHRERPPIWARAG